MILSAIFRITITVLLLSGVIGSSAFSDDRDTYKVTLEDAIITAAKNNFDIALERINVQVKTEERIQAESEFDPTLGSSVSAGESRNPNTSAFASPEVGTSDFTKGEISAEGKITSGAEYNIAVSTRRDKTNSPFEGLNPSYSSSLSMDITQPLLKNAGSTVNRWRIITSVNNADVAMNNLRAKLSETITIVRETYWELLFQEKNLKAQEEALDRARDMEKRVRTQVDVGSLAPIEIVQAQAFVAVSEEKVIEAEHTRDQSADRLLKLLNPPGDSGMWSRRLSPSDQPWTDPPEPNVDKGVAKALTNRPEILAQKKAMANNNIELVYRENQKWPELDLFASVTLNGVRGDAVPITRFDGEPGESIFGGDIGDTFSDIGSLNYYNYSVGLKVTYPLGSRSSKASAAIAAYRVQTGMIKLKNLEKDIIFEVRDAVRQISAGNKKINAARFARVLAKKKLEAETEKFEVGASTSFNVLEFQKDLTQELSNELRAIADARKALARYYRAIGGTLKRNNISLGFPK